MEVDDSDKPINFEYLCDLCSCSQRLNAFLRLNKLLFNFHGRCLRCVDGVVNLRRDRSAPDGQIWRCSNKKCTFKCVIRKHSFFSGSHLSIQLIVKIIYFWSHRYPNHIVLHETRLNERTVVDFFNFCREVCSVVLEEQSEPIGGPGKVVEIDESKFGKRKYNRGKRVDGVWVFGGIERDSETPKCFFTVVEDRSAKTLIPLIKRWILPGTTILSDCWKAYSSLCDEGYVHETVNHSVEFVTDRGHHTNTIESTWNALKKSLPRYGTSKNLYNSYFAEYCMRRKFLNNSRDKFIEFLKLVARVYHPPTADTPTAAAVPAPPEPTEAAALLSAPGLPAACTATSAIVDVLKESDVGNFDLNFNISDSELDTTMDLFD